MEEKFYLAAKYGKVEEVKEILRNNPSLNVNWEDDTGWTALFAACFFGLHDSVASILLTHPTIDVNLKNDDGKTPFSSACSQGKTSFVRLLLRDSRVKVNEPENDNGYTPLKQRRKAKQRWSPCWRDPRVMPPRQGVKSGRNWDLLVSLQLPFVVCSPQHTCSNRNSPVLLVIRDGRFPCYHPTEYHQGAA